MSTLRVSNIEAKSYASSPTVDEKVKIINSQGRVLMNIDGKASGITTVGINTTGNTFSVSGNGQNVTFSGIVTSTTLYTSSAYINTIDASSTISINQNLAFASGKGIDFSAGINSTTMTSELLSDYEEGTWTPRISGTSGGNYTPGSGNSGWYTKIGKMVYATATVVWSASVTPYSGLFVVGGLPYVALNSSDYRAAGVISGQTVGIYASGSYNMLRVGIDGNKSFVYIIMASDIITTGVNYSHAPNVLSTGTIYGLTITYQTDS